MNEAIPALPESGLEQQNALVIPQSIRTVQDESWFSARTVESSSVSGLEARIYKTNEIGIVDENEPSIFHGVLLDSVFRENGYTSIVYYVSGSEEQKTITVNDLEQGLYINLVCPRMRWHNSYVPFVILGEAYDFQDAVRLFTVAWWHDRLVQITKVRADGCTQSVHWGEISSVSNSHEGLDLTFKSGETTSLSCALETHESTPAAIISVRKRLRLPDEYSTMV